MPDPTITATLVRGSDYTLRCPGGPDGASKTFVKGQPVEVTADERAWLEQAFDAFTSYDEEGRPYSDPKAKFTFT